MFAHFNNIEITHLIFVVGIYDGIVKSIVVFEIYIYIYIYIYSAHWTTKCNFICWIFVFLAFFHFFFFLSSLFFLFLSESSIVLYFQFFHSVKPWWRPIKYNSLKHLNIFILNLELFVHLSHSYQHHTCPVGWGCRIHRLLPCRGVRPPLWVSWIWH